MFRLLEAISRLNIEECIYVYILQCCETDEISYIKLLHYQEDIKTRKCNKYMNTCLQNF